MKSFISTILTLASVLVAPIANAGEITIENRPKVIAAAKVATQVLQAKIAEALKSDLANEVDCEFVNTSQLECSAIKSSSQNGINVLWNASININQDSPAFGKIDFSFEAIASIDH